MNPEDSSLEQPATTTSYNAPAMSGSSIAVAPKRRMPLGMNKLTAVVVSGSLIAIILLIAAAFVFSIVSKGTSKDSKNNAQSSSYKVGDLSVQGVGTNSSLEFGQADHLAVNGQLRVSNGVVLTPSATPTAPTAGQIYYDRNTNAPYYYNGSQFISLAPTALPQYVGGIGGVSGAISVGAGLQITGNQLSLTSDVLAGFDSAVTSFQGQTGAVSLSAGAGISISGTTITNQGVLSLAAGTTNIVVSQDDQGNYTLSSGAVVGTGTTGQIGMFTGSTTIGNSILSQSGTTITTAGNLTVTGAIAVNSIQQRNSGSNVQVSAGNDAIVFTAGGRTFSFPTAGPTSQTICTTGVSCASGGGVAVVLQPGSAQLDTGSGSSIFVNNTGGGNLLQLQGAGSDRLVVTNSGNATLAGNFTASGGTVTLGGVAQAGSLDIAAGNGRTASLRVNGSLGQNTVYTLPDPGSGSTTICVSTGCAPSGAAGGDLSGMYPNPTIAKLQGSTVTINSVSSGQILQYNGTAFVNQTVSGDITISGSGITTIGAAKVTNAMLVNSAVTVTPGNGLSGGGPVALGTSSSALSVNYGSTANTAVQGNTVLVCASGTGNLSGGGNSVTLGAGGACGDITITNSPTFSGNLAVQGASGVTVGATGTPGNVNFVNGTNSNLGTLTTTVLNQATTYTLPDPGISAVTICLSTGNCAGAGGGIVGSGTAGNLAKFNGSGSITNSGLSESGSTLSYGGNVQVGNGLSVTAGGLAVTGNSSITGSLTGLTALTSAGTITFSGLNSAGVVHTNASGVLSTGAVVLGTETTGSYVSALGALTGLTTSGNSGAGSTPSLSVSYGSTPGTAVEGSTTVTCAAGTGNLNGGGNTLTLGSGGSCNNISIVSAPTFSGLVTANGLSAGSGQITGSGGLSVSGAVTLGSLNAAGVVHTDASGNLTTSKVTNTDVQAGSFSNITGVGTLTAGLNIASGQTYRINGTDINTAGTLSNVAYLNQANNFSAVNTFTDLVAVQGAAGLSLGTNATAGLLTLYSGANNNTVTIKTATQANNVALTVPANTNTTDEICLRTLANCAAAGGVTGSGTSGRIAKFNGSNSIADSNLSESGTTLTYGGNFVVNAGSGFTGNLLDLQLNGASRLAVNQAGNTTVGGNLTVSGTGSSGFAGSVSVGTGLTVSAGGANITGNSSVTGALSVTTGLTVSAGDLSVAGSAVIGGTLSGLTGLSSSGTITFSGLNSAGVVHTSSSGVLSTSAVLLGTETSGNYVSALGTLTGLTTSGNTGAGSTPTLAVSYGSTANTAVQGNTTLTCASGTGNLSGGGDVITLGSGGSCGNITISNSPTFSGSLSVTGASGATIGVKNTTAGLLNLASGTSNYQGTVQVGTLTQDVVYTLPAPGSGGTATICLSTGNCAGAGGGITGSGTSGRLAKFNGTGTITDSTLSESGTTVSASGNVVIQGGNSLSLGTATSADGSVKFYTAAGTHTVTLQAPASDPASNLVFKLPSSYGSNGDCLKSDGAGTLTLTTCTGGVGGGVTSLDSQTGVLTLSNSSGTGGVITIDDASTSQKGIAQFNATNFSVSSGTVNTIQNIAITSTPTFGGATLNGTLTVASNGNITQTGSGTLSTGTGAVSLNGATSVTGTNTFTVGTGLTSLGGGLTSAGTTTLSALGTGAVLSNGSGVLSSGTINLASGSYVSGTLAVGNGGTGATTLASNGVLYGNGTGAVQATAAAANSVLVTNGSNVPSLSQTLPSAVQGNITTTGALTTGSIGSGFGTISTGNNITTTATIQGATLNATSAIQLGGTSINTAGTLTNVAYLNQANSFSAANTFTGSVAVQGAGGLSLGTSSTAGLLTLYSGANANTVTIQTASQANNVALTIPANTNTTDQICLRTLNNCATANAITGSGTNGRIAKFNGTNSIADSNLSESGTTLTYSGNAIVNAASGFTGNLLDLRLNGSSKLSVTEAGNLSTTGSITAVGVDSGAGLIQGSGGLTISSGITSLSSQTRINNSGTNTTTTNRLAINTVNTANISTNQAQVLVYTGGVDNPGIVIQTTGTPTRSPFIVQNNAGTYMAGIDQAGNVVVEQGNAFTSLDQPGATNSSATTLRSGNSVSGNSGAVSIDSGNSTSGTTGAINIGTANSTSITLSKSGGTVRLANLSTGVVLSNGTGQLSSSTVNLGSSSYVSGTLAVANGGTGATTLAANGILYGNGTSAIQATAAAANSVLVTDGSNVPSLSQTLPAAVQGNITSTGALTSGSIASGFGTISTGNNITTTTTVQGGTVNATSAIQLNGANINTSGTLTNVAYINRANNFTNNNTITTNSSNALTVQTFIGATSTLVADSTNNRVAVNKDIAGYTLDVGGDINTSGVYRVSGTQISSANLSNDSNLAKLNGTQTFTGVNTFSSAGTALSVTNNATVGGTLQVGTAGSSIGSLNLANSTSSRLVSLQGLNPTGTGNATIQFPSIAGGSTDTVCLLTANNCAVANGITGTGSTNYVARFTGTNTIGTGILQDTGTQVGIGATPVATKGVLTVGTDSTTDETGGIYFGTTVNLYRSNPNQLRTDNQLTVTGGVYTSIVRTFDINSGSTNSTSLTLNSGNIGGSGTGNSASVTLKSGDNTNTGNTGSVFFRTGNATSGNSGNISLDVGTASGTTGTISLGTTSASALSFGNSGAVATFSNSNNVFSGNAAIQGSGGLTLGNPGVTGGSLNLANASSSRQVVLQGLNPTGTGNATIQIPSIAGGSTDTVCLVTLGNCGGSGGGVTGSGTAGRLSKFTSANTIADSGLSESGTTLTYSGNAIVNAGSGFTGNLLDVQLNGSSRLAVNQAGNTNIAGTLTAASALTVTSGGATITAGDLALTAGNLTTGGTQRLSNAGALGNITGYTQSSGNFLQSGSGTFGTGTGAVSLNGATTVAGLLTTSGGITNTGATLNTALALGDLASGPLGTAAATVDSHTSFTIAPSSGGRTYTIPSPTTTTAGRVIYISNIDTTNSFTIGSNVFSPGSTAQYVWNGSAWSFGSIDTGVTTVGAFNTYTAATNGATISGNTIYLQSATASVPGLVDTAAQTFAGAKTFNGAVTLAASGTALTVSSGASSLNGTTAINASSANALQVTDGSGGNVLRVDTANSTAANVIIGGANKQFASLRLQQSGNDVWGIGTDDTISNDSLFFYNYQTGNYVANINNDGAWLIRPSTDTSTAFRVQNAALTSTAFNVDTQNTRVGVGTAAPSYALDVAAGTGVVAQFSGRVIGGNASGTNEFVTLGQANGAYIQNQTASAQAANFNIQSATTTSPTAVVRSAVGQTANIFEVRSGSDLAFSVSASGETQVGLLGYTDPSAGTSASLKVGNNNTTADYGIAVGPAAASKGGILIRGKASQTGNLMDFQNSSGNTLSSITAGGALQGGNATGTDAAGTSLSVNGGQGTGTGAGGSINFGIAKPGSTGSTRNTLTNVLSLSGTNGSALFKNAADSTTALQVQNAAGNTNLLTVDTSNNRVGIGAAPTTAGYAFQVAGDTLIKGSSNTGAVSLQTAANGSVTIATDGVAGGVTIGNTNAAAAQTIFIGANLNSGGSTNLVLGSLQSTSATTIQAGTGGLELDSADGVYLNSTGNSTAVSLQTLGTGSSIKIGTDGIANTVQIGNTTGAVAQTINIGNNATASSNTTLAIGSAVGTSPVTVQGGTSGITLSPAGGTTNLGVLIKPVANSNNAFKIQNAAGTADIMTVDTINAWTGIGAAPTSGNGLFQVSTGSGIGASILARLTLAGNTSNPVLRVLRSQDLGGFTASGDLLYLQDNPSNGTSTGNLINAVNATTSVFSVGKTGKTLIGLATTGTSTQLLMIGSNSGGTTQGISFGNDTSTYLYRNSSGQELNTNAVFLGGSRIVANSGSTAGTKVGLGVTTNGTTAAASLVFAGQSGSGTFMTNLYSNNGTDLKTDSNLVVTTGNLAVSTGNLDVTSGVTTLKLANSGSNAVCFTGGTNGDGGTHALTDCSGAPAADYAERYPIAAGATYGDIVATGSQMVNTYDTTNGAIDWTKLKGKVTQLIKANTPYQANSIGIISDNYGDFTSAGNNIKDADNPMPVALNGRVPVNIAPGSAAIQPGDYVTTSAVAGKGMKATSAGYVVGKALSAWDPSSGDTSVMVFVEPGYYGGPTMASYVQNGGSASFSDLTSGTADFADLNVSGATTLKDLTVTGSVAVQGDLTVQGLLSVGDIQVSGHIITRGGQPAGQTLASAGTGATVTIDGTDTAGTITVTTGATPSAGDLAQLLFAKSYGKAPKVVISPSNDEAAGLRSYKGATTLTDFSLRAKDIPAANTTYQYDYFIAE